MLLDKLFGEFEARLRHRGLIIEKGAIVDATIVKAPVRRNEDEPKEDAQKPSTKKAQHIDRDASFTSKGGRVFFGYKNHIRMDSHSKLITDYCTTPAHVYDSQVLEELLSQPLSGQTLFADSGYSGKALRGKVKKSGGQICIMHKRNKGMIELTDYKKRQNRSFAHTRSRVEHVFGHIKQTAGGYFTRRIVPIAIGMARAHVQISLQNLCYNFWRTGFLLH